MDKEKILIVEDDPLLRELYTNTLTDDGYLVESAIDGEQGLEKMKAGGYDLVLLDIILPKMDGLSVMKQYVGSSPTTPNKKIVFLTNLDKDEEIKEALKLGNGYLIKSEITPGDLLREVKLYLSQ